MGTDSGEGAASSELSILEEELVKAESLKAEGNVTYAKGRAFKGHTFGKNTVIEACGKYAEALQVLKKLESEHAEEAKDNPKFVGLLVSVLLNISQASLFLESPEAVINCCSEVLQHDPKNVKGYYRRSKAHVMNDNLVEAEADLKQVALLERKKVYYDELQQLRAKLKKQRDKESYLKETEEAMTRLACDAKNNNSTVSVHEGLDLSPLWLESCGVTAYTKNGSLHKEYAWGQTLREVHVILRIRPGITARDVVCQFSRTALTVEIKHEGEARFSSKLLSKPITVHESTWEVECDGCLHLVLYKEPPTQARVQGEEWWKCVFPGECEIDPEIVCSAGEDLSDLPEYQKREIQKSVWEDQQKTPEEKKADEEFLKAKREMLAQAEERDENNKKAMKNPEKKAFMEMMQKNFPDIPVEFK